MNSVEASFSASAAISRAARMLCVRTAAGLDDPDPAEASVWPA